MHGVDPDKYLPTDYSIVPPSPEVGKLIEFSEIPVDYHTGQPDISFTLFNIEAGDLSVPVTISYSTSGVRDKFGSLNAGLGWSLNTGAVIGRSVTGLPDETNKVMPPFTGLFNLTASDKTFLNLHLNIREEGDPSETSNYVRYYDGHFTDGIRMYEGYTDFANDICNLGGLGLNATIIYDQDKELHFTSSQPLKITQDFPYQTPFVVTDAMSNTYTFGAFERSVMPHAYGDPHSTQSIDSLRYISAWHLTKIHNIQNDSITFNYMTGNVRLRGGVSSSESYAINYHLERFVQGWQSGSGDTRYNPCLVQRISGKGMYAVFSYSTPGLYGRPALRSIKLYYSGTPSKPVKTYEFHYDGVFLSDISENGKVLYRFTYYRNLAPNGGADFEGYSNNTGIGRGGVPACPLIASSDGDNVSVNPLTVMNNCIKTITYITGGKTEFIWEANEYSLIGNEPVTQSINSLYTKEIKTDTLCPIVGHKAYRTKIEHFKTSRHASYYLNLRTYFQFDPSVLYGGDYYSTHYSDEFHTDIHYPNVRITSETKGTVRHYYIDNATIGSENSILLPLGEDTYTIELLYPYDVVLAHNCSIYSYFTPEADCGYITISTHTPTSIAVTNGKKDYWPGVRIRTIKSYFDDSSEPLYKDYFYSWDEGPANSSGVVQNIPDFMHQYVIVRDFNDPVSAHHEASWVYVMCNGHGPSSPIGSPSIEYSNVGVRYSSADRNNTDGNTKSHMNWYEYSTAKDTANMDYAWFTRYANYQPAAARMRISRRHRRGLLMKEVDNSQSGLTPATTYTYNVYENMTDLPRFTTNMFIVGNYDQCFEADAEHMFTRNCHLHSIGTYTMIPYNVNIATKTVNYNGMITKTAYEYFHDSYSDSLDAALVKAQTDTLPDGTIVRTEFSYNIDLLPDTTKVYYNGNIRSVTVNSYYPNTRRVRNVYESTGGDLRLTYEYFYTTDGRLSQINYHGVPLVSYIWGYNGLYPIIEARGIDYVSLKNKVGNLTEVNLGSAATLLPDTDYSTYRWQPLVGAVEISDARGGHVVYSYDELGHLTTVADFNNYLISKHEYNY